MIYSYCKRCKKESPEDVCQQCGKRAPVAAQRDIWSISTVPLADGRIWLNTFFTLLSVVALLLLLVFGVEIIVNGTGQAALLWQSAACRLILALLPLGMGLMLLLLLLQGREVNVFVLDKEGAHQQTWHKPSFIKSWARLQSVDRERDVRQLDGTVMHLSQERHLLWKDVQDVKYRKRKSAISIFHTPHCAPMVLKLPYGEYDLAEAYVQKYTKKK